IQRRLDREEKPRHYVKILATDDDTPAKTATATLTVIFQDINDNAPRFLHDYRPVLMENHGPQKITEVEAIDDDDRFRGNGPPFNIQMDPTASEIIRHSFKVENISRGANGDGVAVISSVRTFDRENQKEYHVPIIIKDAGTPQLTGTSTLTIVIGDENDHKMQPDSKNIFVYNLIEKSLNNSMTPIGRVNVLDLDDWDLSDKKFFWANSIHPNFSLNEDDGMISMLRGTQEGSFFLRFHVHDMKRTQIDVKANVTVTIKDITEEDVINSGSVRIAGISAEDFIRVWDYKKQKIVKSKYEKFREEIAKLFETNIENIDVFSVQLYDSRPPITDVRFSVHGSLHYQPVRLNGLVLQHRSEIESQVGINITMVSIEECLYENKACKSSCTNNLVVSSYPYMVNANKTSFVGIRTQVIPECTCEARNFTKEEMCNPNPCLNGGKCKFSRSAVRCYCHRGFDGPRCQMTTRSFEGDGFAWFSPFQACDNSHLSMEILTDKKNGLILYNGPITNAKLDGITVSDFISLELVDGRPRLLMDFGSGTLELRVNTKTSLNNGEWHRLDIFWDTQNVRIVVDHCIAAEVYEPEDGNEPTFDSSECQAQGMIPPFNEYLNVNSPLQLGGLAHKLPDPVAYNWQYIPNQDQFFQGCIRNFIVNSELYDLTHPGLFNKTQMGCPPIEEACRGSVIESKCSRNGICYGSIQKPVCKCKPGWTGPSCDIRTNSTYFETQSYVKFLLSFKPDFFKTEIQLRFHTWQEYGELFRISDQHNREYGILAIRDGHLHFRYNLNSLRTEEHHLCLSAITVNDGKWHSVVVERHGSTAMLMLDGGEGRRFNETVLFTGHMLMDVDKYEGSYAGGKAEYTGIRTFEVYNDFKLGCLDDIRLNGKPLPLPPNKTQWSQATMFRNIRGNCISPNQCINVTCPTP
ncbi:UNVERIFIED_CONTAM: hypothetical protein GTU68_064760, partial [Idotea baltica]|nr:hypothetical protein [Idotea baltica]